MADLLFNPAYNAYTTQNNIMCYVDGPQVIGQILKSGEFYSGRWGGWYQFSTRTFKYAKAADDKFNLTINSPGETFPYLTGPSSNSSSRITNVSMAFDANAQPVMVYQDNGDSNAGFYDPPRVNLASTGTSIVFSGRNAVLYSTTQTNFPYGTPNPLYPRYQTGDVACYYSIEPDKIYARYLKENFAVEHLMSSGIPTDHEMVFANINPYPFINQKSKNYLPYRKVYSSLSADGKVLRLIQGAPTISFASDLFEDYYTGEAPHTLISGYGRFSVSSLLGFTQGRQFPANPRIQDDYEIYATGDVTILPSGQQINPRFPIPGTGKVFALGYLYDGYTGYNTGYYTQSLNLGRVLYRGTSISTDGFWRIPSNYYSEMFEDYPLGFRNVYVMWKTGRQESGSNGTQGYSYGHWSPLVYIGPISGVLNRGTYSSNFSGSGRLNTGNSDLITNTFVGYPYKGTGVFFNNHVFSWDRPDEPLTDFTMEVAIWPSGWVVNSAKFIEANPVAGFSMGRYSNTGRVQVILNNTSYTGTSDIITNKWNYISFVRKGTTGYLYNTGVLKDQFDVHDNPITGGKTVHIGKNFTSNNQRFAGYMDEFRLYNYPREDWQIAEDWNRVIDIQPGLVGYFSLRNYVPSGIFN